MKKPSRFLYAVGGLLALAACLSNPASTVEGRIQEKSAVFAALPAEKQKKLREGVVEIGDTANMVYVALGRPDQAAVTADGTIGIWTYERYFPSEAVSPGPLYAIRPHPRARNPILEPPSGPGMRDGTFHDSPAIGAPGTPPRAGGPFGTEWATSNYQPVTLHVSFKGGHVFQLTTNELNH